MKQLYDPHMFNYTWESVIPGDDMIVGSYYVEDVADDQEFIDHMGQVERLAREGSTSSWMEVGEETPELRDRLMSKVLNYFEIPARIRNHIPICLNRKRTNLEKTRVHRAPNVLARELVSAE